MIFYILIIPQKPRKVKGFGILCTKTVVIQLIDDKAFSMNKIIDYNL